MNANITAITLLLITGVIINAVIISKRFKPEPVYHLYINGSRSNMQARSFDEWRTIIRIWIQEDYDTKAARSVDLMNREEFERYILDEYKAIIK